MNSETGPLRRAFAKVRKAITGVEMSRRYHTESHRLNITYRRTENEFAGAHCDVRAWWLTEDELIAELDAQRLGQDDRRSWDRDEIEHADITRGPTIIDEGNDVYR